MSKHVIVGFDPASTRNIGWAIFEVNNAKNAKTPACWEGSTFVMPVFEDRWQVLWPMLQVVDTFLENIKPDVVIVEKTSSFSGGFVTGQVSQCMGVILAACGKHDIKVEFVYPSSVKKKVSGNGRAKKGEMKKAVKNHLEKWGIKDIKFDSEHCADATANIFCWLINNEIELPDKKE